jgi:hypothetical protein
LSFPMVERKGKRTGTHTLQISEKEKSRSYTIHWLLHSFSCLHLPRPPIDSILHIIISVSQATKTTITLFSYRCCLKSEYWLYYVVSISSRCDKCCSQYCCLFVLYTIKASEREWEMAAHRMMTISFRDSLFHIETVSLTYISQLDIGFPCHDLVRHGEPRDMLSGWLLECLFATFAIVLSFHAYKWINTRTRKGSYCLMIYLVQA